MWEGVIMISLLKRNKLFLIIFALILIFLIIDSISYLNEYNEQVEMAEFFAASGYDVDMPEKMNVISKVNDYFRNRSLAMIQYVFPLLVIVCGVYGFHQKIHSGFFKNEVIRKGYKKYKIKELLSSWKAMILIPLIVLCSFIFALFVCEFNFSDVIDLLAEGGKVITTKELALDLLLRTFNLSIVSIFCINIGLIFSKKNKSFILTTILSYLFIVVYQLLCELIIGPALSNLFNSSFFANGLTLFNFWYYDYGVNWLNMFIYALTLVVISTLVVFRIYHNKEDVIIDAEK